MIPINYDIFRYEIIQKYGDFFTARLEHFFTKAIELASNEKYEEAIIVGNDALVLAKYSNAGYAVLYLIGMLCQAYLDNNQPEIANDFLKAGMTFIDNKDENYDRDIDQFLDLKIIIDEELKKKSGA
jgi:hypothetical protein